MATDDKTGSFASGNANAPLEKGVPRPIPVGGTYFAPVAPPNPTGGMKKKPIGWGSK